MAVNTSVDIGTLITKSPDIYHGRPVITGTRIPVMVIVGMYKEGLTPEQIASEKSLPLAQVYAALAYYHANRKEVEDAIAEEQGEYDAVAKEQQRKQGQ